jgi:hypothetical protein
MVKVQERRSGLSSITGYARPPNDALLRLPAMELHQALLRRAVHFGGEPKLQVEINEAWRDKNGIKAGDDWRRGIIGDWKDADWVFSFLSRHSIRDPGVCLDERGLALHGKGGAIATVLIEGATGAGLRARLRPMRQPCDRRSRGCCASGATAGESPKRRPHGGAAYPRHAHARPQVPLAVSGVLDTEQLSGAFSLGQSPEALSRDG